MIFAVLAVVTLSFSGSLCFPVRQGIYGQPLYGQNSFPTGQFQQPAYFNQIYYPVHQQNTGANYPVSDSYYWPAYPSASSWQAYHPNSVVNPAVQTVYHVTDRLPNTVYFVEDLQHDISGEVESGEEIAVTESTGATESPEEVTTQQTGNDAPIPAEGEVENEVTSAASTDGPDAEAEAKPDTSSGASEPESGAGEDAGEATTEAEAGTEATTGEPAKITESEAGNSEALANTVDGDKETGKEDENAEESAPDTVPAKPEEPEAGN